MEWHDYRVDADTRFLCLEYQPVEIADWLDLRVKKYVIYGRAALNISVSSKSL